MSMIEMTVESQFLHGNTKCTVLIPDCPRDGDAKTFYSSGKKYKVLWLLHGTYGDNSDWVRRTMLEVFARERQLICVMPSGLNADYTNWPHFAGGFDVYNYILNELMPLVHNWFPASSKREDNFIAGLSMGGWGVMQFMLNSDKFAAGCVMSMAPENYDAMPDPSLGSLGDNVRWQNQIANKGGFDAFKNSDANFWRQILQRHAEGTLPKMYFTIGEEDFLFDLYQVFHEMCSEEGIDFKFEQVPNYGHEWRFWNQALEKAMDFFGLEKDANADAWRGLKSKKNFFTENV